MSAFVQLLPKVLDARDPLCIVELGAGEGQTTAALRMLFPRARMWAFEPDPRSAYKLRHTPVGKTITVVEAAISDTDGEAELRLSSGTRPVSQESAPPRGAAPGPWTQSSSLKEPVEHLRLLPWVKFGEKAKVKTQRLDTFAAQHHLRQLDLVWAEVQGAEDLLVAGGLETLSRTRIFFTRHADVELYRGQLSLKGIGQKLPGRWQVIGHLDHEVMFKNVDAYAGMYL